MESEYLKYLDCVLTTLIEDQFSVLQLGTVCVENIHIFHTSTALNSFTVRKYFNIAFTLTALTA